MTAPTPITRARRRSPAQLALLGGALIVGLLAVSSIAIGGVALWGEAQKDENGYLSTGNGRFATNTRALATESLDIDLDGVESIVDSTELGDIRLEIDSRTIEPLFVGIARTADASAYLRDVQHTTVTDVDYSPFEASYNTRGGDGRPGPPARQSIWEASVAGTGPQTLTWDLDGGDWSVVAMNADGSPGVRADLSVGAEAPFLAPLGWGAIGGGGLLLISAGVLALFGMRSLAPVKSGG